MILSGLIWGTKTRGNRAVLIVNGRKAKLWLGTTVRGMEHSREGEKGPTCGYI